MRQQTTGLTYDRERERWALDNVELHCGDGLQVCVGGHWLPVRVEYQDRIGWLLYADDDAVRILPSRSLPARPDPRDHRW